MRGRFKLHFVSFGCAVFVSTSCTAELIDFEDLTSGDRYFDGDVIVSGGVPMTVQGFGGGHIDVQALGDAGGSGNELEFFGGLGGGGSLEFNFGSDLQSLSLNYGSFGGGLNVSINGVTEIVGSFTNLPDTIGGVDVTVASEPAPGGFMGTLTFDGLISSFAIGGQEFVLDNVNYQVVPTPGALAAGVLWLIGVRRRRRTIA